MNMYVYTPTEKTHIYEVSGAQTYSYHQQAQICMHSHTDAKQKLSTENNIEIHNKPELGGSGSSQ